MSATDDILIRIQADNSDAVNAIKEQTDAIEELKKKTQQLKDENKGYQKELKDLDKTSADYASKCAELTKKIDDNKTAIAANNEAVKAHNKVIAENSKGIQDNMKFQKENCDSIKSMRSHLSMMKQEYINMSKAMRESDAGKKLQEDIKAVNDELVEAEKQMGDYRRLVGSYEEALKKVGLPCNQFISQIIMVQENAKKTGATLKTQLVNAIKSVGNALKTLMANPIVLAIAAVVAVIAGLIKVMKGNEEQTMRLKVTFAPLHKVVESVENIFQALVGVLMDAMKWIGKLVGGLATLMEKIPIVGKYIKQVNDYNREAIQLAKDENALILEKRRNQEVAAKSARDVAELRAKIAEKETYSAQERLDMSNKAIAIEKEQADRNLQMAKEELRIEEQKAKRSNNTAEAEEKLSQLRAAVYNQEREHADTMRRLNKEHAKLQKEVADEEKAALEERAKARKEFLKKVKAGEERIRELTLELMAEGKEKELALLEKKHQDELAKVEGTEKQKAEIRAKLEEKYQRDKQAIEKKYSAEELARQEAAHNADLARKLELAAGDEAKIAEVKLEQLRIAYEKEKKLAAKHGEDLALLDEVYKKKKEAILEAEKKAVEDAINAHRASLANFLGTFSDFIGEMAGDNEEMLAFQKVVTLAQIAINTANAISGAIAAATTQPTSTLKMITSIASGMAAVMSGIASAHQALSKAPEAKAPTFSRGGDVTGPGTGTSDSIPAMLSNGESVMTAKATSMYGPVLSLMNQAGGGLPIGGQSAAQSVSAQDFMSQSVIAALQAMPNPVVSVEDINRVQNQVQVNENLRNAI